VIFQMTLGPLLPDSAGAFVRDVFATRAGWALILVGCGVGFLFAAVVLAISVVSFPLMLDRRVSVGTAIRTSLAVTRTNPLVVGAWGLLIAVGLVVGSIPLFSRAHRGAAGAGACELAFVPDDGAALDARLRQTRAFARRGERQARRLRAESGYPRRAPSRGEAWWLWGEGW